MNHKNLVQSLAKPGEEILLTLSPVQAHTLHMLLGLSGEVGELIDCLKKDIIYRKPFDYANAIEELGDIEFFLGGIRTIQANIKKLTQRYGTKYSDKAASLRRDKNQIPPSNG